MTQCPWFYLLSYMNRQAWTSYIKPYECVYSVCVYIYVYIHIMYASKIILVELTPIFAYLHKFTTILYIYCIYVYIYTHTQIHATAQTDSRCTFWGMHEMLVWQAPRKMDRTLHAQPTCSRYWHEPHKLQASAWPMCVLQLHVGTSLQPTAAF